MGFLDNDWWQSSEFDLDEQLSIAKGMADERSGTGDSYTDTIIELANGRASWRPKDYGSDLPDVFPYFDQCSSVTEIRDRACEASAMLYQRVLIVQNNRERAAIVLLADAFNGISAFSSNCLSRPDEAQEPDEEDLFGSRIYERSLVASDADREVGDEFLLNNALKSIARNAIGRTVSMFNQYDNAEQRASILCDPKSEEAGRIDNPTMDRQVNALQERKFAKMAEAKRVYAEALALPAEKRPSQIEIPNYSDTCNQAIDLETFREVWSEVESRTEYTQYLRLALQDLARAVVNQIKRNETGRHVDVPVRELQLIHLYIQTALCDALESVFSPIKVVDPNDSDVRFEALSMEVRAFARQLEEGSRKPLTPDQIRFLATEEGEKIAAVFKTDNLGYKTNSLLKRPGSPFADSKKKKKSTKSQKKLTPKDRARIKKARLKSKREQRNNQSDLDAA